MGTIRFITAAGTHDVPAAPGETLLDAARRAGLLLDSKCGGQGICRGCTIEVRRGAVDSGAAHFEAPLTIRSCQFRAAPGGDLEAFVPQSSLVEQRAQIDDSFVISGFHFTPIARRVAVRVPEVTLEHATPLDERLAALLAAELGAPVAWSTEALREAASAEVGDSVALDCVRVGDTWRVLRVAPAGSRLLGVAADIGTTTVVVALVDLATGEVLRRASMYNQQIRRAEDVASRISVAAGPGGLVELQRLVMKETLEPLVEEVCLEASAAHEDVLAFTAAGNTVMTHLLAGVSPWSIGRAPFEAVVHRWPALPAAQNGLRLGRGAPLLLAPSISGYVGGDLVADLYATGFLARGGASLLIDIGTNGEIILGHEGALVATATAAGPAFEGHGVASGQRAARGAVERVRITADGEVKLRTIGNATATGLCGSAMIDFLAEALRAGFLNEFGRLDLAKARAAGRLHYPHGEESKYAAFLLLDGERTASGKPLFITEADIAQLLKAKGAIYAGARRLLASRGLSSGDLDRVILAGGFARHIDIENAITIGLLPDLPRERFEIAGNGSLAGAYLALVEEACLPTMDAISRMPRTHELNRDPGFEDDFADALALPNLDLDEFPTVRALLDARED